MSSPSSSRPPLRTSVNSTLAPAALALALAAGVGACAAGSQRARGAPGASSAPSGFGVIERGEPAPVTALAFAAPYLYAGSAVGLRRSDVAADEYEWMDGAAALAGRTVSALGADGKGTLWIATEKGLSRLSRAGGGERHEPVAAVAGITALVPVDGAPAPAAWAAGPAGLYWIQGRSVTQIEALREVTVTSLDRDRDGRAVWAGTRGRGLFRVDREQAKPVLGPDKIWEVIGTAVTSAGMRVVAGRGTAGAGAPAGASAGATAAAGAGAGAAGTVLVFFSDKGVESFRPYPDVPSVRLLEAGGDAVLVGGAPGAERAFTFRPLAKGEAPPPGGLRFVPVGTPGGERWAGIPLAAVPPPHITRVAEGGGALYFGTEHMGVARGAPERAQVLSGSSLTGDAERLYVACASPRHCFVVTEGPRAWRTDGDDYAETRVGEHDEAQVLAVAEDAAGAIYALSAEPKLTGLVVSKRAPGEADLWQEFARVPLELPVAGPPAVSLAAVSPEGVLWVGVRAGAAAGRDETVGYGAVEIDLATKKAMQHHPARQGDAAKEDILTLPPVLTALYFDRQELWFASMSGVSRWAGGELKSWGENDGMPSELVHGVGKGPDGKIWAATSEGPALFDGTVWRAALGGEPLATRALVRDGGGRTWLATAKGLRVIPPAAASSEAEHTVVEGDMRDVVLDRFGRVWALSTVSIARVEARP